MIGRLLCHRRTRPDHHMTQALLIGTVGRSIRDVQMLAGRLSLVVRQRYIEGSSGAKRKIVDLVNIVIPPGLVHVEC